MFSQIYLYRDLYGSSFSYDDNGNVVNVKDLTNLKSQATYDDYDNLLTYIQPGSATTEKYTFTYGTTEEEKKRHLPQTATTPMGVKSATVYDEFGNATENIVQPADGQPFMKTETVYTENGNYVASRKDARGNSVVNWLDANGKVLGVTDPEGNSVTYAYDNANRITGVTAEASGKIHKNSYTYENDRLKSISHNTTSDTENDVTYIFEYDALGRKKKVKVGNSTLSENVYSEDRKGLLTEMNFGNGAKVRYEYDDFGRTTAIYVDEPDPENEGSVIVSATPKYEFVYDARGIASVIKDNVLMTETRVTSDLADRPSESVTRDTNGNLIHKSVLNYDGKNRVKEFIDILPDSTHKTAYTYDADNRVTEVKYDNSDTHKVNLTYDLLNRVTNKTVTNGAAYSTTFHYVDGDTAYGENATTPLIAEIEQGSGANAMNFAYTYDSRGNITSETRTTAENPDGVTVSYEYDELGQLIRVNDPNDTTADASGTTWVYTYDRGGNILNKAAYVYTTSAVITPVDQCGYTYGDNNWKDKLTGYKDKTFTYDDIGNPIFDLNDYHIRHFDWEAGRRLKELSGNGYSIQYKYNHNGLRTQKIWQPDWHPEITNYILNGKQISQMTVDYHDWDEIPHQDVLYFYYDAQGKPAQVNYNGSVYTYVHNLQGDIVGILDSEGMLVVEYKYDAWGRPLGKSGSMANTLGKRNPFRYRGYVYDEDSYLYYLRSRYYNPEWGRFLNGDTIYSGHLFAYCHNEPIKHVDQTGKYMENINKWYYDTITRLSNTVTEYKNTILNTIIEEVVPGQLNEKEKELAMAHPIAAIQADWARNTANTITAGLFGEDWWLDDTKENAFKHCLWNALMAYAMGEDLARQFGEAHEYYMMEDYPKSSQMDLHNNEVGYTLITGLPIDLKLHKSTRKRYEETYQKIYKTSDWNIYIIIDCALGALHDGRLIYIK